eukprot:6754819-Heterocapsa_arctica.AAC.1
MMFIFFWMRPWILLMIYMEAAPRILADDLLILAFGPDHARKFRDAYTATHHYLADIGALVAAS